MESKVNDNPYLKELETTLAKVSATFFDNEEAAQDKFEIAGIKAKSSQHAWKAKKKHLDKTKDYYNAVTAIGEQTEALKAFVNKTAAMTKMVSLNESTVRENMADAAKSIEAAMESVAILSSGAASINAKTATEDGNTRISKIAAEAYQSGLEAAVIAEECTTASLNASILAAKSNAGLINSLIASLGNEAAKLYGAMDTLVQTARSNLDQAQSDYAGSVAALAADELEREMANADYCSAKEVNTTATPLPRSTKALKRANVKK